MGDQLSSLDMLTRLKLKRIGLSIDDFGTDHASLAQLRDFRYDGSCQVSGTMAAE